MKICYSNHSLSEGRKILIREKNAPVADGAEVFFTGYPDAKDALQFIPCTTHKKLTQNGVVNIQL